MARIWDFSVSFEPKTLASALARFWQLDGWKFTTLLDANQRPVDHCPISLEPMEDPVLVCDGHIYDKNSITQWLAEGNKLSPCTRQELAHTKLLRIQPFCAAIEKYLRHQGKQTEAEEAQEQALERRAGHNLDLMANSIELASFLERKLLKRRALKPSRKREKRSPALYAGQLAYEHLQRAIDANEAEIREHQKAVEEAREQLESLKRGIEEEAARVVQRVLLMKPLREKSATTIQRFAREYATRKGWRDRSEKLAKHCALAMLSGNEELVHRFQSKGDLDYRLVLKFLKGSEVNRVLPVGVTPLHRAAMAGQALTVRLLCRAGAEQNAVGPTLKAAPSAPAELQEASRTALYAAAQQGHLGVVKVLCAERAEVDKGALLTGASPLFAAAEHGHEQVVRQLCEARAQVNSSLFDTGLIPLHAAAKNGYFEVVRYLCACRGDVCKATSKPVVTQLISGEDAQTRGDVLPEVGITPLFLAARGGHDEVVDFLCKARAEVNRTLPESGCTTLHMAARLGHEGTVHLLLAARANPDAPLSAVNKFTPLHAAASAGCERVVHLLCEASADTDQITGDIDATPLYLAAAKGFVEVVKILCRQGADLNKAPPNTSATPLYMACLHGHLEVVQSLCLAKANLNKELQPSRKSPVFIATSKGHTEIVKALCVAGADFCQQAANQVTPLHVAVMKGYVELVEGLVMNKADVNHTTALGLSALHLAALNNRAHLARCLAYARGDKNQCAKKPGSTPLMMAVLCGHGEVVDALCEEEPMRLASMLQASKMVLHVAAHFGFEGILWRLCSCGMDVNEEAAPEPDARDLTLAEEFKEDADWDTLCEQPVETDDEAETEDANVESAQALEPELPGATALFIACFAGHMNAVQILVQAGALLDAPISDGTTPLLAATQRGHLQVAQFLLQAQADVNGGDSVATPLYVASMNDQLEAAEMLCQHRADVNLANANPEEFPVNVAAQQNSLKVLQTLIQYRAKLDERTPDGTALTWAARHGLQEVAELLIAGRADVNARVGQTTVLQLAAEQGNSKVVKLLCGVGAKPTVAALAIAAKKGLLEVIGELVLAGGQLDEQDEEQMSPLMWAARNGHTSMVQRLAKVRASLNLTNSEGAALHLAIHHGRSDVVQALCGARADVNLRVEAENPPLVAAAQRKELTAAKSLVQLRADANLVGLDGLTAVHWAAKSGDPKMIELLTRHRGDVNLVTHEGATPLHLAVRLEEGLCSTVLPPLVLAKAEVNKRDQAGLTPLLSAIELQQVEAVRILCEKRADANISSEKGAFPLLAAAETSCAEILELLLKARAELERRNPDFRASALHIAAQRGGGAMVKKLLLARARADDVTTRGHTALHYAAWGGHIEVLLELIKGRADLSVCVGKREGINAFFMAVQGHQDVLRLLFQAIKGGVHFCSALLHVAARGGQVQTVTNLCAMRCNVNEVIDEESAIGMVESLQAARCPYPCGPSSMLSLPEQLDGEGDEVGDEVIVVDSELSHFNSTVTVPVGVTPLYLAAMHGQAAVVPILLKAKASIDLDHTDYDSPLLIAAEEGHVEVLQMLCQQGARVNCADQMSLSPLHLAAANGHGWAVEELLKHRADVNYFAGGRGVLHVAVVNHCVDIVELLCQARADPDARTKDEVTPLVMGIVEGNFRTVQILCRYRADTGLRCPQGSPIELARERKDAEIMKILKA